MMKRMILLLLALLFIPAAFAEGIEICYMNEDDRVAAAAGTDCIRELDLQQQSINGYTVAVFTWMQDGNAYECCIGGLSGNLTEAQAYEIAGAFASGVVFELEGESLVDAEKASNKLPIGYGKPVEAADEVRREMLWGDSKQCWAGSLSDMLQITGWGRKAIDPNTGAFFVDEDALFSYITSEFSNMGSYQAIGAEWFFNGMYERDTSMADRLHEGSGGLLPQYETPVSKAEGDDMADAFLPAVQAMLSGIKTGGVIGLDVQMIEKVYPLKDGSGDYASYSAEKSGYVWEEYIFCEEDEPLITRRFVLDDQGSVVFMPDDANDRGVMEGLFLERDGCFYPVTVDQNGSRNCAIPHVIDEADVDLTAAEDSYTGSHALTVIGWIRCVSEADEVLALLIIDSDNDAHVYSPVAENASKQDRPNKYTLFFTEKSEPSIFCDYASIMLTNYYGKPATISGVTLMGAYEE